jgi:hypothetical protein
LRLAGIHTPVGALVRSSRISADNRKPRLGEASDDGAYRDRTGDLRLAKLPELPDWAPSPDHYPRLKADGGHLVPWNVRLSHVLCNREDYGWRMRIRRMLEKGMSLEEIAENLNHKGIRRPHGNATWSATSVRKAFVS